MQAVVDGFSWTILMPMCWARLLVSHRRADDAGGGADRHRAAAPGNPLDRPYREVATSRAIPVVLDKLRHR